MSDRYNDLQDRVRGREISAQTLSARYNGLQDYSTKKRDQHSIRPCLPGTTAYKIEYYEEGSDRVWRREISVHALSARYNGLHDRVRWREIGTQVLSARYSGLLVQDRVRGREISSQTLFARYSSSSKSLLYVTFGTNGLLSDIVIR